ncbi:MAG TPA: DHA2 family efflux MFS transporter permease subunit [Ktedonobacteraceae bacterium]|jgi:EmrB/QacA subfamily drug resistance transporter|nr:DHA2 family efflux MFS transporter permease subunit [Ktedonobacteraceae bacterium]
MQIPATTTRQEGGGLSYKWIVAIVVIFGIFMSILDSTIVNIAIPRLQGAFGADLNSVQWVLTAYILAEGVATPLTGFFSDRIGIKRLYLLALVVFTAGSALCGLAWSLPALIFFRILQGAGGAFLFPLSITLLYREFPLHERGMAMGVLGVPVLLAPAFGPTVGGYLVTFADWQSIFYINVPIGIVGIIMGMIFLREGRLNPHTRLDILGFLFSGIGLACVLYALSDASTDGWGSSKVLGTLAAGVLLLIFFVITELSIANSGRQPLLDVRLFADIPFTTSNIASILVTFALYGGLFLIPVYLQDLRGLSAYQAGILLIPQAFASMIATIVGGRLVDRFGVRAVVIPGLIILCFAMWLFSSLNLYLPFGTLQVWLILRSLSLGLCIQPLSVSMYSSIRPRDLPQATSMSTAMRFVASSLGVAVLATLVQTQTSVHYTHLAEQVTPASPLGQYFVRLQGFFVAHGATLMQAKQTAIQVIAGMVQRQAYVLAMDDAFWLSLGLAIIALIAAFFVRTQPERIPQPAAGGPGGAPANQEEEPALVAVH